MEIMSLEKLIKWSIDKEFFHFEVASDHEDLPNRTLKIKTENASICNEYLKHIPIPKAKPYDREKSLAFLKK
jgi:hypothetical protein